MIIRVTYIFIFFLLQGDAFTAECPQKKPYKSEKGQCFEKEEDVHRFQGCVDLSFPYLCSDGSCAASFSRCKKKYYECPTSILTKCADGVCRKSCDLITSSACSFSKPIKCGDGRCVSSLVECSSFLCQGDTPFLCSDNSCQSSLHYCNTLYSNRIVLSFDINTDKFTQTRALRDFSGQKVGELRVPKGNLLSVSGITISEIANTSAKVDPSRAKIYTNYFGSTVEDLSLQLLLRSSLLKIRDMAEEKQHKEEKKEKRDYQKDPLGLEIRLNLKSPVPNDQTEAYQINELICLAKLEQDTWVCQTHQEANVSLRTGVFNINEPGIYGLLFYPESTTISDFEGGYCGYLCQDKRLFIIFWIVAVPLVMMGLYMIFEFITLNREVSNVSHKNYYLQNKMDELENVQIDFTGQTILEKIDEGVQYYNNALRNEEQESIDEIRALNTKLNNLREELKSMGSRRNRLINSNKTKVEEIRRLHNLLCEYE